jgi:hypothetical protein
MGKMLEVAVTEASNLLPLGADANASPTEAPKESSAHLRAVESGERGKWSVLFVQGPTDPRRYMVFAQGNLRVFLRC